MVVGFTSIVPARAFHFHGFGVWPGGWLAVRACEQLHAMPFQEAIQEANLQQRLPDYVRVANKKRAEGERQIRRQTRAAGRRFAEHDLDGSKELDFDEFYCMLPYSLREERSVSELRQCFSAADSPTCATQWMAHTNFPGAMSSCSMASA